MKQGKNAERKCDWYTKRIPGYAYHPDTDRKAGTSARKHAVYATSNSSTGTS